MNGDGTSARPRGRPPRLSREQIVAAAVEIGARDLTMTAVAERLGTTHQSLYRWVTSREELAALVADVYVERLDVPLPTDGQWRDSLRAFAHNLRRVLADIPGFAIDGLVVFRTTPAFLRLNERMARTLVDAGFEPKIAQRIYQVFGTALLGWIAREEAYDRYRDDPASLQDALRHTTERAEGGLPIASATAIDELTSPADERYEFLLDTLLRGFPDPAT
jgi:TetR/AcrR family tetracycline transcriptional repressor